MGLNINTSKITPYGQSNLTASGYKVYIDSNQRGVLELANGDAFKIVVSNIDEKTLNQFQLKDWEQVASKMVKMLAAQGMLNNFSGAEFTSKAIKNLSSENVIPLNGANTTSEQQEMINDLLVRKREIEAPKKEETLPQTNVTSTGANKYAANRASHSKKSGIAYKVSIVAGLALLGYALLQGGNYINKIASTAEVIKLNDNYIHHDEVSKYPLNSALYLKTNEEINKYYYNTLCPLSKCITEEYQKCFQKEFRKNPNARETCFTDEDKKCLKKESQECLKEEVLVESSPHYMHTTHHDHKLCATESTRKDWVQQSATFGPQGLNLGWVKTWKFKDPENPTRLECYLYDLPTGDAFDGNGIRLSIINCSDEDKDEFRNNKKFIEELKKNKVAIEESANELLENGWNPSKRLVNGTKACGIYHDPLKELIVGRGQPKGFPVDSIWKN
ncbi:MAG: hypothetical protein H0X29_03995 [Parachlamydiaceae bacterium]|nr:hypothetical protein [Parachlamydiaceae bacterium]